MADIEKELHELRREIVEARNLVIKTDNQLKNLQADVKAVTRHHEAFERRSWANGATAYILFMTLAALGAYMYAKNAIAARTSELDGERTAKEAAIKARDEVLAVRGEAQEATKKAQALYDKLLSEDVSTREKAVEQALSDGGKELLTKVSSLEARAVTDKALSLRQEVANAALESGRTAFNRKDYRTAAEDLTRHWKLSPKGPEEVALLLLGQARHALKDWKEAAEALEAFLKASPSSRSADYATLIYGEAVAESGDPAKAIKIYREGSERFGGSQFASWMRSRAKRLEQAGSPAE